MKRQLLLATTLLALVAAMPAPKPVITLAGVSTATKLDASKRAAIAPYIAKFDAGLQKMAALHAAYVNASPEKQAQAHAEMQAIHEECHDQYAAIIATLDPEQVKAFHEYLHAQLQAAGIPFQAHMQHSH